VRISPQEWKSLNTDPETPLLNRAIQAQLAPGSVFKIVMATAMLESKAIPATYTAYCPGYADFYGRTFHCDHAHGEVDLHKAIVASCDVYFYHVGQLLGIDRISYYANSLGLGHLTGIDLPGEEPGLVPSEAWVERVYHHKWYPGSTISVAIGQGSVEATPIQLARMIAAVASGGNLVQPHLLKDDPNAKITRFPISDNTVQQVTQGMYGVVNEPDGTTYESVKLKNIEFCGKTGTAQTESYELQHRLGIHLKENGWFVGYEPRVNPDIVVAALVQKGVWGSNVAPIVRDVVKAYYDETHPQEAPVSTAENTLKKSAPSHSLVAAGTGVPVAPPLPALKPAESRDGVQAGVQHQ
jgi:penicillin-binding protein 2